MKLKYKINPTSILKISIVTFNLLFIINSAFALNAPAIDYTRHGRFDKNVLAISINKNNESLNEYNESIGPGREGGVRINGQENNHNKSDLFVFIPNGLNLTNLPLNLDNFQLLKLDSDLIQFDNKDLLLSQNVNISDDSQEISTDATDKLNNKEEDDVGEKMINNRQARKFNLFKGVLNKPKVSPLYLINGTVCRFVNAIPICTTLATTGLLPSSSTSSGSRPQTSNQFSSPINNVQFANQQQQQQQQQQQPFRPAAIMDDDSQDINVESGNGQNNNNIGNNSTTENNSNNNNSNRVQKQPIQPQRQQQLGTNNQYVVQATRPFNFLISRRPNPWRQRQQN